MDKDQGSGAVEAATQSEVIEVFEYLDALRESGRTNMWGASAYVERELGIPKSRASELTGMWMRTFDGEISVENRAAIALANPSQNHG